MPKSPTLASSHAGGTGEGRRGPTLKQRDLSSSSAHQQALSSSWEFTLFNLYTPKAGVFAHLVSEES